MCSSIACVIYLAKYARYAAELPACLAVMADHEPSQVLLVLQFRGDPPLLHSVDFKSAACTDKISDLQNRAWSKAIATILLLYRAAGDGRLFRIRTNQSNGTFVHTILNAKKQQQGKSDLRDLARGYFLKLFVAPTGKQERYLDIDVSRLRSSSISVIHDGRTVDQPLALKNLAARIATTAGWNLNDYPIEVVASKEQDIVDHQQYGSDEEGATPGGQCRQTVLDNPARFAIEHALRHFCDDPQLRVGQIRSNAELEDLWAIDNEAYGEASISYETFREWWRSFSPGLQALFFRNCVMGAIGIWPLSDRCARLFAAGCLKESALAGRTMHAFLDVPAHHWYMSGIVLRPELIGGRAVRVLLSHGLKSLLASVQIDFPCQLLALAHSRQGQALLEGFNFFKLQNASAMPDKVPLFSLQVPDRDHLVASLKARGLVIA